MRGEGNKPRKSRRASGGVSDTEYDLTVFYPEGESEKIPVIAGTLTEAVGEALRQLTVPKLPNRVRWG